MALSVGDALRDGLGRTFERSGLQLVGAFVGIGLLTAVASDTLTRALLEYGRRTGTVADPLGPAAPDVAATPTPLALGLGVGLALGLFVAVALLGEAARIVAVRTLVSDRTAAVPAEYVTRNIAVATLNGFAGGVVVLTLTVLGLVAVVVPGVFVAVSFFFVRQEVAVRDVNFVDAMAGSWDLSAGNRLEVLALAVAVGAVELLALVPGALAAGLSAAVGLLVSLPVTAVAVVFGIASVSRAYDQLRGGDDPAGPPDATDDEPDYEGALTAEDLPPPAETPP